MQYTKIPAIAMPICARCVSSQQSISGYALSTYVVTRSTGPKRWRHTQPWKRTATAAQTGMGLQGSTTQCNLHPLPCPP